VHFDKEGRSWRIGTVADVAWIMGHTSDGLTVTAAIPPGFEAYATFYPSEGPTSRFTNTGSWRS
jgi:hypothetical protein